MQFSQEYDLLATLSEGNTTRVLRARNRKTGARVVLKILGDEYPEPGVLSRFRYEYELTRKLAEQTDKVLEVGRLRKYGHRLLMELQDIGGRTLASEIASAGPGLGRLDRALAIALDLARALSDLHQSNVMHLGLCPKHIVLDQRGHAVKIIDFGQASELTLENAEASNSNLPFDLLNYIAPEQSGRMNRTIDRRADLYSLGATLYHLFTGHAPFEDTGGGGTVELIHAHIAQMPVTASVRHPEVPEPVSEIIQRLLEKSVSDRYQSAAGLAADLERCLNSLRETGRIAGFELASADYMDRLAPPQRLYGREAEKRYLMDCFERCLRGGSEMIFVKGFSGIGKTSLVNDLQRPVALANGHFVSGKFDATQRDRPYFALVQALRACVRQKLLTNKRNIEHLSQAFREALGPNGKIMTDVVPEVEIFIGPQPEVPELGAEEAQNRFSRVMEKFLQALASPDSPLIMFIDDLQWADTPSLTLLRRIISGGQVKHLLIVGAYRDNEVSKSHPVSLLQQAFEEENATVGALELKPMTKGDVANLISEVIRRPVSEIGELADLCFDKTGGNPFFLNQFLDALSRDGVLRFNHQTHLWEWDAQSISKSDYSDNVVDLVLARIRRMPEKAIEVLKVASCIGSRFDLQSLVDAMDQPQQVLTRHLWDLLKEQLVLPMSDRYRMAQDDAECEVTSDLNYRFLHDRVQQAAYNLQTDSERAQNHLRIARKLYASLTEGASRKLWFDVTSHFNNAADLVTSQSEKWQLARLNLEAARRAKATAAFESAAQYLQKGLATLPENAWVDDYDLTLDLHIQATDTAYLTRAFDQMDALAQTCEREAKDLAAIVRLRDVELRALISQDRRAEAISKALPLLAELGAPIGTAPTFDDYGAAFGAAEGALAGRDVADLISLPDMTDVNARAAMRILCLIFSAAYFAAPQYLPLIIAKLVELSGRHGNTEESAFGYAVYGLNLCAFQNDVERGFEFGELSRAVLDRFDARVLRARTLFIANICITHWKRHISETLEPLLEAYQSGLDTGDTEYATHALMIHNQHLYAIGHPLGLLSTRMAGQRNTIKNSKEEAAFSLFMIYQQTLQNWQEPENGSSLLTGSHCDEAALQAESEKIGDRTALFHMHYNKTVLAYAFGQYEQAKTLAEKTRELLDGAAGVHQIPIFHFYESLVLLAHDRDPDAKRISENQTMLDQWASHCLENQRHRWHLVEAIRADCRGEVVEAIGHFDTATVLAQQHGYVQEEALVHEQHARFWLGQGNRVIASVFLQRADRCLAHWGGEAKRKHLQREFEGVVSDPAGGKADSTTSAQTIDIQTVTKSAQAITESTGLTDLLSQMMLITMQMRGHNAACCFCTKAITWRPLRLRPPRMLRSN